MDIQGNIKFNVIGLGELLWDLLPDGPRLGGAPANFAYHAHSLGANAEIVSSVGNDNMGRGLVQQLKLKGLSVKYISTCSQFPTGTVSVQLDNQGHPTYQIHEHVAWDYIPWNQVIGLLAQKADAVCFGTLAQRSITSRKTIQNFLTETKENCLRVYDINLRQSYYNKDIIEQSLRYSNILKLNEEELPVVCNLLSFKGSENELLNQLLVRYELQLIALTKGNRGSVILTSEGIYSHPGIPVKNIVDTVGAGDSYTAALVMGLLYQEPIEEISRLANELAAYICSQPGAMPSLPTGRFIYNRELKETSNL